MQMIVGELKESGVDESHLIYIDLELSKFRKIKTPDQLEDVIKSYSLVDGKKYLFIDEIQNVVGFEEVINGLRADGGYSIFITGSNSYLLSGELMTKLTGRYIEFEIFPLNYQEYEGMKKFYGKKLTLIQLLNLPLLFLKGDFHELFNLMILLINELMYKVSFRKFSKKILGND